MSWYQYCLTAFLFIFISYSCSSFEIRNEPILPIPNAINLDSELVNIGNKLFHDKLLSKNGTVSCSTCHSLTTGGVDGLITSKGMDGQVGNINAPTVFNSSLNIKQFWDGRALDLNAQIDDPIVNKKEMGSSWNKVIGALKQDENYQTLFSQKFSDGITISNIKLAIVAFEESLLTPNSRFDQYLKGSDSAITSKELEGYNLFKQYGCISCHQGVSVGGNLFQKLGIMKDYFKDRGNITEVDLGRYNVTKKEYDRHVFKVPSLRNINLTSPYFHDGSVPTLFDAVEKMMIYQLDVDPSKDDILLIVEFLKTLTGEYQGKPL